jgi:hypothetical protein
MRPIVSTGCIKLTFVRLIVEEDEPRGQFNTLSKKEGGRVLMTMVNQLLVCSE